MNRGEHSKKRLHLSILIGCAAAGMIVIGLSTVAAYVLATADAAPQVHAIGYLSQPLKVDGVVDRIEWAQILSVYPVQLTGSREPTAIHLAYDDHWLYLGIVCDDSDITPRQDEFARNDSVRCNVGVGSPGTNRTHAFTFLGTPQDLMSARFRRGPTPPMRADVDTTEPLDTTFYQYAASTTSKGWSCELALAWSAVDPNVPTVAEPFSVTLSWWGALGGDP